VDEGMRIEFSDNFLVDLITVLVEASLLTGTYSTIIEGARNIKDRNSLVVNGNNFNLLKETIGNYLLAKDITYDIEETNSVDEDYTCITLTNRNIFNRE
jgi:hypothetical protein